MVRGNTHIFVLSCKFLTCKHIILCVSMYFLHLVLITFTPPPPPPHYIKMVKGLFSLNVLRLCVSESVELKTSVVY